jgi:hypothetical protein
MYSTTKWTWNTITLYVLFALSNIWFGVVTFAYAIETTPSETGKFICFWTCFGGSILAEASLVWIVRETNRRFREQRAVSNRQSFV